MERIREQIQFVLKELADFLTNDKAHVLESKVDTSKSSDGLKGKLYYVYKLTFTKVPVSGNTIAVFFGWNSALDMPGDTDGNCGVKQVCNVPVYSMADRDREVPRGCLTLLCYFNKASQFLYDFSMPVFLSACGVFSEFEGIELPFKNICQGKDMAWSMPKDIQAPLGDVLNRNTAFGDIVDIDAREAFMEDVGNAVWNLAIQDATVKAGKDEVPYISFEKLGTHIVRREDVCVGRGDALYRELVSGKDPSMRLRRAKQNTAVSHLPAKSGMSSMLLDVSRAQLLDANLSGTRNELVEKLARCVYVQHKDDVLAYMNTAFNDAEELRAAAKCSGAVLVARKMATVVEQYMEAAGNERPDTLCITREDGHEAYYSKVKALEAILYGDFPFDEPEKIDCIKVSTYKPPVLYRKNMNGRKGPSYLTFGIAANGKLEEETDPERIRMCSIAKAIVSAKNHESKKTLPEWNVYGNGIVCWSFEKLAAVSRLFNASGIGAVLSYGDTSRTSADAPNKKPADADALYGMFVDALDKNGNARITSAHGHILCAFFEDAKAIAEFLSLSGAKYEAIDFDAARDVVFDVCSGWYGVVKENL